MSARATSAVSAVVNLQQRDPHFILPVEVEQRTQKLVEQYGTETAARILGNDVSDYANLLAAGRLVIDDAIKRSPKTVQEYCAVMKKRLNPVIHAFILKHAVDIQTDIDKYDWVNYRHDYVSASNMVAMYLAKIDASSKPIETPVMLYMRVSVQFYFEVGYARVRQCFKEMAKGYYTHATPTLFNAGMVSNQMSSCFLKTVSDNMESILEANFQIGMISKTSGGNGVDCSEIRHSEIGAVGSSKGVVPFLMMFDKTLQAVDQGGLRKGAGTFYLRLHHIDIFEFINMVDPMGDHNERTHNLDICLWTCWIFWDRVRRDEKWTLFCPRAVKQLRRVYGQDFERLYVQAENDPSIKEHHKRTIRARDLLDHIIRMQRKAGEPYIMSGDTCNFKSNHKHIGYIRSSNLCVAGNTQILTDRGYERIDELVGQNVKVWNGNAWSEVVPKKTGEQCAMITIFTNDGLQLTCTNTHQFLVIPPEHEKEQIIDRVPEPNEIRDGLRIMACDLVPGMRLMPCPLPIVPDREHSTEFRHPYTHAVLTMKGCKNDKTRTFKLEIAGVRAKLMNLVEKELSFDDIDELGSVPRNNSLKTKLLWLAGLFDSSLFPADANVNCVHSSNRELLKDIQFLLHTVGCRSSIVRSATDLAMMTARDEQTKISQYTLFIHSFYIEKLFTMGMHCHLFSASSSSSSSESASKTVAASNRVVTTPIQIATIINNGEVCDTYCFNEKENHAGIFNGILTGQCLEVVVYTDKRTLNSCNLGSMSLPAFVKGGHHVRVKTPTSDELLLNYDFEKLGKATASITENLNSVIDYNRYPLDKYEKGSNVIKKPGIIHKTNKKFRNIGIGVQGWAETMHQLDIFLEDASTAVLDEAIFACMYFNSLAQTVQLSINRGVCSVFSGSPFSKGELQFDMCQQQWKLRWAMRADTKDANKAVSQVDFYYPMDPSKWRQQPIRLFAKDLTIIDTIQPTWDDLKRVVVRYGTHNSQMLAVMPTATTSRIMRNGESVENHMCNIYNISVLFGDFTMINRYMVWDLQAIDLWNENTIQYIIGNDGMLTGLFDFLIKMKLDNQHPVRLLYLEKKYRTQWEISQKIYLKRAATRGKYIDGSQSTNIAMAHPTDDMLKLLHDYTDHLDLKTGMYYLRQKATTDPVKFTVNTDVLQFLKERSMRNKPVICNDHSCCQ